ncbi:hypothetical protein [Asticcacaulis sp. AND118]|uniref:hypothetical protein n=1 Tax=Asticcacaulis sp. AND118 TaxID=2840468 RepID=UPI001D000CAF|nr:hypothetical protein [Asticcacaulis sp. AND118]UDF04101.1 hypothetical protein LH365_03400 [Asticcacaulis sp. AND118]
MTVYRRMRLPLLIAGAVLMLAACATQGAAPAAPTVPGFWMGLVHGAIAPFALIGHIFDHDIRIYAMPNKGGWYDFGFLLGLSFIWGGGSAGAASRRSKYD